MNLEQKIEVDKSKLNYTLRLKLNNNLTKREKQFLYGKPISELVILPQIHNNPLDFTNPRIIEAVGEIIYAQKENNLAVANWALLQGLKKFYGVVDFSDSRLQMPEVKQGDLTNKTYARNVFKELQRKEYQEELLDISRNISPTEFQKRKKELQESHLTINNKKIQQKIEELKQQIKEQPSKINDTYGLFRRVFSEKYYDDELILKINDFYRKLTPSDKNISNPHIIPDADSLVASILKIQNHFSDTTTYQIPINLASDFINEKIDLQMYNLKQTEDDRALFALVKNKQPESTMNKYLLTLAKRHKKEQDILEEFIPEWMYTHIIGCRKQPVININDHAGFSITTSDIINIKDTKAYEDSFFNELKSFYAGFSKGNLAKISQYKNHFRNDLTKQAVEMYISPTEESLYEGLTLPFPEIAGDPKRYYDILKISMHLFGAKEMAANHLGDPRIEAHYSYKQKQIKKNQAYRNNIQNEAQLKLAEHENFFRSVFNTNAIYKRNQQL